MTFISLFAGIGGIDLGLERAGMRCVAQVEINPFCRAVLAKHWPDVPKFEDVRTFNRSCISGDVDLIAGGFPCQDISLAGRRAGIKGERSGLWAEFYRLICEFRPGYVFVENVAALLVPERDGGPAPIARVLGDLAAIGFDAEWTVLSACAMGAPHSRERVFLVAYANEIGHWRRFDPHGPSPRFDHWKATESKSQWADVELWLRQTFQAGHGVTARSATTGIHDGVPSKLDDAAELECDAYGNAVVPQIAEWIGRRIIRAASAPLSPRRLAGAAKGGGR